MQAPYKMRVYSHCIPESVGAKAHCGQPNEHGVTQLGCKVVLLPEDLCTVGTCAKAGRDLDGLPSSGLIMHLLAAMLATQ
jgi:hypothetical protein